MKKNKFNKAIVASLTVSLLVCSAPCYAEEVNDGISVNTLSISDCASHIKNVYKSDYPENADIIDEIVDTLSASDVFIDIFECEGATAFQIIEDSLHDALDPSVKPFMQTDDLYTTKYTVPKIQQIYTNYCGPASTVMALIGSGSPNHKYTTNTSVTNGWQTYLATGNNGNDNNNNLQTGSKGTNISNITKVMNNNIPSVNGYTYKTKAFTYKTYNKALDFIEISLVMDAVPIIRVEDTSLLKYYKGETFSHYVVITAVDFNAESITLIDPHYDNKYFGTHQISFDEFNYFAENSNDLWISTYTKVSSNNEFEYN